MQLQTLHKGRSASKGEAHHYQTLSIILIDIGNPKVPEQPYAHFPTLKQAQLYRLKLGNPKAPRKPSAHFLTLSLLLAELSTHTNSVL